MASARARMGELRRKQIKRQKKARVAKGIFDTTAVVSSFVGGQAKKADTAWGEYEAGYKELGGEDFERPKFGQGYFKGPEGEVQIGGSLYDRSKIQEAGSFLGSDAAAVLTPEMREQYLGRTAPGRDIKSITLQEPSKLTGTPYTPSRQHTMPGPNVNIDIPSMIKKSGQNLWGQTKDILKQQFTEGPEYGQSLRWDQQVVPRKRNLMESLDGNQMREIQRGGGEQGAGWLNWLDQDENKYDGR